MKRIIKVTIFIISSTLTLCGFCAAMLGVIAFNNPGDFWKEVFYFGTFFLILGYTGMKIALIVKDF